MQKIIVLGANGSDGPCAYCGNLEELRPYGRNGAKICFDCGMKPENKDVTDASFDAILSGETEMPTAVQAN